MDAGRTANVSALNIEAWVSPRQTPRVELIRQLARPGADEAIVLPRRHGAASLEEAELDEVLVRGPDLPVTDRCSHIGVARAIPGLIKGNERNEQPQDTCQRLPTHRVRNVSAGSGTGKVEHGCVRDLRRRRVLSERLLLLQPMQVRILTGAEQLRVSGRVASSIEQRQGTERCTRAVEQIMPKG